MSGRTVGLEGIGRPCLPVDALQKQISHYRGHKGHIAAAHTRAELPEVQNLGGYTVDFSPEPGNTELTFPQESKTQLLIKEVGNATVFFSTGHDGVS